MVNHHTQLEEYLQSLENIKPIVTDSFFYTRLKAKMEKQNEVTTFNLPLKPIWIITGLCLLLLINSLMLISQKSTVVTQTEDINSIQSFANSYDQTITSY